jgi:phage terminase small subunit
MKELTPKQQKFVEFYSSGLTALDSYLKAGYSKNGATGGSCNLLKTPQIQQALKIAKKETAQRSHITKSWVLNELQELYLEQRTEEKKEERGAALVALKCIEQINKMLGFYESDEIGAKNIVALQINVKEVKNEE